MTERLDKQLAYVLVILTKAILLLCFFVSQKIKAQDTVVFNAVEIKVVKIDLSQVGKKTEKSDSSVKEQFKLNSLSDFLSNNSTVFIKNYGNGAIATTALRGGNAAQTAILWNGFNLQNTMLGQTDLSLLPAFLFDEVTVEYGGSSSVWGSGAIGGSIHLNSNLKFGAGTFSKINFGAGSYGKMSSAAQGMISKERFVSSTKIYFNKAENNYKYLDTTDHEEQIKYAKNASYVIKGLMQDLKFLLKKNQTLSLSGWFQDSQRNLQAYDPQAESRTYQSDKALRLMAGWTYARKMYYTLLKSCFFQDNLNYNDSLSSVYSSSSARTFMLENEHYFKWLKNQQFNVSVNILSSSARSDNYLSRKDMSRLALLAGNKFLFFNEKLVAYASLRFEYYSISRLPLTGSISFDYQLTKTFHLKTSAAKVYRQPTLNELYWQPGGNEQLKPEQGYTYEGEINFKKKVSEFSFFISMAAYTRNIKDWILWVPGSGGHASPINIQDVWSRGTETSWKVNYQSGKFKTGISFLSSYVLSTVQSSQQENDNTVGKQLIYTPRYVFTTNLFVAYGGFEAYFFHNYCGFRYTSSDNTAWINPYQTASLRLNYNTVFKRSKVVLFASCNNVFNENYEVIQQRPMPLRNFEIGITLQLINK